MRMKVSLFFVFAVLVVNGSPRESGQNSATTLQGFNRKFRECVLNTDHTAMPAIWAEDGVDLMPGEAPLLGKKAIATWLRALETRGVGSRVSEEELEFHDLYVSGDWASEWADEHQIVQPKGKPPIEGYGKIALVLHREENKRWTIKQEMWNDSPHR
jgi:ketosteroid isomerase-like protein